jgi:hypothetical protein
VVNFITKAHFASRTASAEYAVPTLGGFADSELEAGQFRIDGPRRLNITGKFEDTTLLTEAERGVRQTAATIPTVAGDPDPARFRSLIDAERSYALNGAWSTGLGEGPGAAALTINGAVTRTDTHGFNGLDTFALDGEVRSLPGALARITHTTTFEGGLVFNKPVAGWRLTATVDGSYGDTRTAQDQPRGAAAIADALAAAGPIAADGPLPFIAPGGVDRAHTQDYGVTSLLTFVGTPFRLPAGAASLTLKAGFAYTRSDNSDTRAGGGDVRRSAASAGINLALPLTSRRNAVPGGIGDLSLDFSAGLDRLSDFGTLADWSAGLTWGPTDKLNLQASYIVNQAAPGLNQLGNPTLLSFDVPVFDFATGQTALVTVVNGGNPNLQRETQRDLKLSANWELPFFRRSNLIVEYFRNRSSDVTQDFPLLTPEIEAAFPGRVQRDVNGQLVAIDRRPVTFSEIASSRLRWGLNLSGPIGKAAVNGSRTGGGGSGGHGRFAGGRHGGRGNGQGRWNLSIFHTVQFTDTVLVAPGGPVLDLLGGDALVAGGVPRQGVEIEGGTFYKGFGLRFNGDWTAPVTVRATGAPGSTNLRFGSLAKLNLRAFVNFGQQASLVKQAPFLKGARLSLKVTNLFNARQRVTDPSGVVPLSYQPDYRDPRGRVIELDFRKMF